MAAGTTIPSHAEKSTSGKPCSATVGVFRKSGNPFGIGAGNQTHLPATDERFGHGDSVHRNADGTGHEIGHGRHAAAVGDMKDGDADALLEDFHAQMRQRAVAEEGWASLSGLAFA